MNAPLLIVLAAVTLFVVFVPVPASQPEPAVTLFRTNAAPEGLELRKVYLGLGIVCVNDHEMAVCACADTTPVIYR